MSKIINIKIDVTKLDKDKFYKGEKGTYANLTIAENKDGESQYGDTHYVFESQSKEDRESGTAKNYVGNGKEFVFSSTPQVAETADTFDDGDLPF
tara:strand:+ start:2330 stop:2614 length:285 start_codon:yes stop_codon:yes gene_type:complete